MTASYMDGLVANVTRSFLPTASPGGPCVATGQAVMDMFGYKEVCKQALLSSVIFAVTT